jgi:hypothetical protein
MKAQRDTTYTIKLNEMEANWLRHKLKTDSIGIYKKLHEVEMRRMLLKALTPEKESVLPEGADQMAGYMEEK